MGLNEIMSIDKFLFSLSNAPPLYASPRPARYALNISSHTSVMAGRNRLGTSIPSLSMDPIRLPRIYF
jgi:hypothetical protein